MDDLINKVINRLKEIDIYQLKRIKTEKQFEDYTMEKLDSILERRLNLRRQDKNYSEGRKTSPDISIEGGEILIELKYDLKNINDIYRLYYQAIKYSKQAKKKLILYVHDPGEKLLISDIKDLESFDKVKVVHIY